MALTKITGAGAAGIDIDSNNIVDMPNTVMYDVFRLTSTVTSNSVITAWARPDETIVTNIGDTMSVASGVFTFPRTGVYKVTAYALITNDNGDSATAVEVEGTTDNSSYDTIGFLQSASDDGSAFVRSTTSGEAVVNISNVSNCKVRLSATSISGSSEVNGDSGRNETYVCFQYLSPAQ